MNERIKELAYIAKLDDHMVWANGGTKLPDDMVKFAELIVKECALYVVDKGMLAGGGCTTVGEELLHVSEGLKKYFGVKE
jgi:hypothetical protein